MTETYRYDAFGTLANIQSLNENGVLAVAENALSRFLYAGEQYDSVSGLYYLRARQYDTVIGRFTQEDSYLGDGRNLYVYVSNNPLKYVDPSGHCGNEQGYSGVLKPDNSAEQNGTGFVNYYLSYMWQNPDNPQISMGAKALVDFIPEEWKAEYTQGFVDSISPVEMEISTNEEITIPYILGAATIEIFPADELLSLGKYLKYGGNSAELVADATKNANKIENTWSTIKHTVGNLWDNTKNFFKKNGSDVVEEVVEEAIDGNGKSSMQMNLQFFADKGDNIYTPSPKHAPISGWGSPDIIPDIETGQELLDAAYSSSKNKQLYNMLDG